MKASRIACYLRAGAVSLCALSCLPSVATAASLPGLFTFSFGADQATIEKAAAQANLATEVMTGKSGRIRVVVRMEEFLGLKISEFDRPIWAIFNFDANGKLSLARVINDRINRVNWCDDGHFAHVIEMFKGANTPVGNNPEESDFATLPKNIFIDGAPPPEDKAYPQEEKITLYRFKDPEGNLLEIKCSRITWSDSDKTFEFTLEHHNAGIILD